MKWFFIKKGVHEFSLKTCTNQTQRKNHLVGFVLWNIVHFHPLKMGTFHTSTLNLQSSILNPQFSVNNPQSPIFNLIKYGMKLPTVNNHKSTKRENDKGRPKPNAQLTHRRRSLKHNSHNIINVIFVLFLSCMIINNPQSSIFNPRCPSHFLLQTGVPTVGRWEEEAVWWNLPGSRQRERQSSLHQFGSTRWNRTKTSTHRWRKQPYAKLLGTPLLFVLFKVIRLIRKLRMGILEISPFSL